LPMLLTGAGQGPRVRAPDVVRHHRRLSCRRRRSFRPGQHLPPARHRTRPGGPGRRLRRRARCHDPVLPRPAGQRRTAERMPRGGPGRTHTDPPPGRSPRGRLTGLGSLPVPPASACSADGWAGASQT
jgi:hypothetical protein